MKKRIWILMMVAALAGCGGAAATSAAEPAADDRPAVRQSDAVWKNLDLNGRRAFMSDVVISEMKPLFIEYHPDFGCKTCHGDDAAKVNFKMPNTLAPLDPASMPFNSPDEKLRNTAAFMKESVVPKMAGLLKEAPYNPATGEGFGCFNCHVKK